MQSSYRTWDDVYNGNGATERWRYTTVGAQPFHDPRQIQLGDTIQELVKLPVLPKCVISLGEGPHPRVWTAFNTWAYANILGSEDERPRIVNVDPCYKYAKPRDQYVNSLVSGMGEVIPFWRNKFDVQSVATSAGYHFQEPRTGISLQLLPYTLEHPQATQLLAGTFANQPVWLNIINLLNYVDFTEFRQQLRPLLDQTTVITYANKVDADRNLWELFDPGRLRSNEIFFEWMLSQGFRPIWQLTSKIHTDDDVGVVFVRRDV